MTDVEYLKDLLRDISSKLLEHAENDMNGQIASQGGIYQTFNQYGEVDYKAEYGITVGE